ncbi:amino acid-binding protein [Acidobacteria bacterium Mor1]|nr:amino acid-binding protein [Acidobacteria bacterium Mor1]
MSVAEDGLALEWLPGELAVVRLGASDPLPEWALRGLVHGMVRTPDELSIVCAAAEVPHEVQAERGWRLLRVRGPLQFDLTGILASLTGPLAAAGVPIFSISTFDTDYLMIRAADASRATEALSRAGHRFDE